MQSLPDVAHYSIHGCMERARKAYPKIFLQTCERERPSLQLRVIAHYSQVWLVKVLIFHRTALTAAQDDVRI